MKRLISGLALALVLGCGQGGEEERTESPVQSLAGQLEQSGLVERLDGMDKRLAAMDGKLDALGRKIESGVRVTATTGAGTENVGVEKAAADSAAEAEQVKPAEIVPVPAVPASGGGFKLTFDEPDSQEHVVIWHPYRGQEKDALEKTCREFTAAFHNIVVDPQEVPFMALRDKIVVTVPRGTGPDLFVYVHNPLGDWLFKGGIVVPLSGYIDKYHSFEALQEFLPDTVKALAYDGTLYGLPMAFKARAMFYNKKLVTRGPSSMDELVEVAKAVQTGEGEDRIYGLIYEAGLLYHHAPFAHGFGAVILDDQGQPHLDSPEMVRSVELIRDLAVKHGVLPDLNKDMAKFLFNSGQAGMVFKGPWFLGEIDEGIEYGVAPMPDVTPGKPAKPYLGADGVYLAECSKNKELAFQVMRYLVSSEAARIRYLEGGQLVANVGVYEDKTLVGKANPALDVFRKQADNSVIMSSRPEMQAVWSTADNALRKVIFGKGDAATALAEAQQKIAHDIANMGKK